MNAIAVVYAFEWDEYMQSYLDAQDTVSSVGTGNLVFFICLN